MQTFTVSFFGHRYKENVPEAEKKLEEFIGALPREHEYVEFLVGRDGEFDRLVSSVIRRCKCGCRSDNSAHIWVMPYETAEYRNHTEAFREYYDEIEICESAAGSHYKSAHQNRNRAMVDRSDLVVFFIQHENGGAWQTMKYAQKQGKAYINLHDPVSAAAQPIYSIWKKPLQSGGRNVIIAQHGLYTPYGFEVLAPWRFYDHCRTAKNDIAGFPRKGGLHGIPARLQSALPFLPQQRAV